ncbi:hypothetical protein AcW2_005177 [Taiwanofungus camphoratus]|nr:hypothetical protein AcW2_005177 [Antrodia cinnamomea]
MNSRWHDRLHPLFFAQVSLFASVTQLNLFSCSFITFNDFLRLVGELRQLTDLHVYMLEILRQSFPHVLTRNSFRGANTLRLKSLELVELPWRELSCFFSWLVFAQFSRTIQTMVIRYPAEDWHSFTSHLIRSINVLQQGQTSLAMPVNHGLSGQERSPTDLVHLLQALHRLESAHLKEEEDVTGRQVLESDYVPGVVTKWTWSQYEDGLIENVHFSWGLDGVADLGNLLKDAGPSVTAFSMITSDLWWSFVPDAARNCLSFQYNTRLRTVRLHVQLEFSDSYELSWPTDLLAGLSPARVEDVHLYARVYFYEQLASFNWAKMDSILADAQFQSLKEVEIVLAIKAHISSPVLMPDHPRSAWETDDPLPAGKVDSSRTRKAVTLPPEWRTHNPSTAEFLDPGMPDMIRTALPKLASRGVLDISPSPMAE